MNRWDKFYLDMAKLTASMSKDPRRRCGAVLVRPDKSVASLGFNGLPSSIPSDIEEQWLQDREKKLSTINHAELNCVMFCRDQSLEGYTLYVHPFQPCSNCASLLAAKEVSRVVTYKSDNERWKESFTTAKEVFRLSGIELVEYEEEVNE